MANAATVVVSAILAPLNADGIYICTVKSGWLF